MFNIKIVWFIIMHDVQQKWQNCIYEYRKIRLFENHTKMCGCYLKNQSIAATKEDRNKLEGLDIIHQSTFY
jgi:hypothetical protein